MSNKMCIFENKLFVVLDTYLIAYSYGKCLKTQKEKILECLKIKLPVNYTCMNVCLEIVDNYVTGLKTLLILLFDSERLCSVFIYSSAFRNNLHEIALPNWFVATESYPANLFISGGLTFLYRSIDAFHLHSVSCKLSNKFDCQFFPPDSKECKILQFKCFGPLKNDYCHRFLFLLIVSYNFSNLQHIKIIGFLSEIVKPVTHFEQLAIHLFFPPHFESVLKAIEITKLIPHFKGESISIANIEWKETMSVICTKMDILIFSNTILQYCCKLPLPIHNIMCMKTEFTSTSLENFNLVLIFENKNVVFITLKKNNCEVVNYWINIESTVIGDVLMKGSKQVLLLKQSDMNSWQNNYILYDMSSFIPVDLFSHDTVPDKCIKTTISGLEKKLQIGKVAAKSIQCEISQKSAAIIDALIKLNEYRVNSKNLKCSYVFQESLVDLILCKDENKQENIFFNPESSVKLLYEKQEFMNNKWIVCLCFINEGGRSVCNPSIKLLMKGSQVVCIQQLFICNSDDSLVCGKYSKQINPKTKFFVALNLEFILFDAEDDIFMNLSWYSGSADEFDNEIFINKDKRILIQNQLCIQTRIATSAMLHQPKRDISSADNLLSVKALQQRINLLISSLYSNICRLEEILMANDPDPTYLNIFESSSKCITFNNNSSLLFGAHFVVLKSSQNIVEIEAFTRNEREVCLLIHYLYQHLPDDIIISPRSKFQNKLSELKKDLAICIKNEIDMLISSFNVHNISEEMRKNYAKLISSETLGVVTIPKATYQRIRTTVVKKECITDTLLNSIN